MSYFYIIGTVLFTVCGQLLIKWRIAKYGVLPGSFSEKIVFLLKLLLDPYIFSGFVSAFLAALFWMAAMTKFNLSEAYPAIIGGLALLTSLFAVFFLKEPLNAYKIIGIILIIVGVYFISKSA